MNPNLTLNLWHDIMYCVGVFVTCNIGGEILRFAAERASAYMKRPGFPKDGGDGRPFDGGGQERYSDTESADDESEPAETVVGVVVDAPRGQDFADMLRQIEKIN